MVKEAIYFCRANYEVLVIYCSLSTWGDDFDQIIIKANPQIKWINVADNSIDSYLNFLKVRIRRKFWDLFYNLFGNGFHAAIKSSALYSQELKKEAQRHNSNLFIGHNLGSIYAITTSARKWGAKVCFDFEDFHRGEDLVNSIHWRRTVEIENEFISQLNAATTASYLITDYYKKEFPDLRIETILNVFPKISQKIFVDSESYQLRLFWFSQTIGLGRGLEYVLKACAKVIPQPRVTLLGNCSNQDKSKILKVISDAGFDKNNITFASVVPDTHIPVIAMNHHIGLCTEDPMTLNRQLCLTNKIFTYMQCKNALIVSNTKAQRLFLEKNAGIGQVINLYEIDEIVDCVQKYQDNRMLLEEHRAESLRRAIEVYNWERESEKMLKFYKDIIF